MEAKLENQFPRALAGALVGAGFAFLFLTKRGRHLLDAVDPWLDEVIRDMQRLRGAAAKAREAVDEGRRSFEAVSKVPFGSHGDWASNVRQ